MGAALVGVGEPRLLGGLSLELLPATALGLGVVLPRLGDQVGRAPLQPRPMNETAQCMIAVTRFLKPVM